MNLLGYLRVSTEEQVRNGNGLDIQRQQIETYALAHNLRVVGWCSDEGVTGTVGDRPGLVELYGSLADAEVDGVIAQADTRFGRSLEVQEAFFARVWSLGKHVYTVQVGEILEDDPDDPMRTVIRKFRGIMAEFEAGMIRKRLRDGKQVLHAQRLYKGGPVPFGWKVKEGGVFVPNQQQQNVLLVITQMREAGHGSTDIARHLNRNHVPTPRGRLNGWQAIQVSRMLDYMQHPYDRTPHSGRRQLDNVSGDEAKTG